MNREDIIKLAREAGLTDESFERDWYVFQLERFAALVAAAAKAVENEACAKVCDSHALAEGVPGAPTWSEACATAIRARGNT